MVEVSIRERVSKARRLCEEGRVSRHGDLFVVRGDTGNYTDCLDHDAYGETCSCKDWRINVLDRGEQDHRCKHIYAVAIVAARG